jgi:hypothetical protein
MNDTFSNEFNQIDVYIHEIYERFFLYIIIKKKSVSNVDICWKDFLCKKEKEHIAVILKKKKTRCISHSSLPRHIVDTEK